MSSPCRSCGAPIQWTITEAGRAMPVDEEPHPEGNIELTSAERPTAHGDVPVSIVHAPGAVSMLAEQGPRYRSHFATCPDADDWRKQPRGRR